MAPSAPERNPAQPRGWTRHLRGHLLQFDRQPAPELSSRAGLLLLLAAVCVELLRLAAVKGLGPGVPLWLLLPALLAAALLAAPVIAQVRWPQLGLRAWRDWTVTEKWYCVHVLVMAITFFLLLLTSSKGLPRSLGTVFIPYLCYGFYQELVYRGMLQTALVRRADVRLHLRDRPVLRRPLPPLRQPLAPGGLPRRRQCVHHPEHAGLISAPENPASASPRKPSSPRARPRS